LIKHESKLDEKLDAHFQCAILYTSTSGERRVRVHNLAVPVSNAMGDIFRYADMDATLTCVCKQVMTMSMTKSLRTIRDQLTQTCVKILLAYRKNCASSTSPGQLILPEAFKLFPLYALCILKSKALKGGPVASDVRAYYMRVFKGATTAITLSMLYPRMIAVHTLDAADNENFHMPPLMRTSYLRMEAHGAYLIENADNAILWLGNAISPQIINDIYGVENLDELDIRMTTLPQLPNPFSIRLRRIIDQLQASHDNRPMSILIVRQGKDGLEVEFSNMLVEDQNNDAMSYVDYLCFVHKLIQGELTGEKKAEESAAAAIWRSGF